MKNLSHFFVKFFFQGGKKTFLREIFDLEFTIQSFFLLLLSFEAEWDESN